MRARANSTRELEAVRGSSGTFATAIALALAVAVLAPSGALGQTGAPVADQSFTSPGGASGLINECCNFVGQTFTAGQDGVLTGVSLDISDGGDAAADAPLRVSIRNTADMFGRTTPGQTVFVTTVLDSQNAPLSRLIAFPQLLQIQAGVKYAIVVNLENPTNDDKAVWSGAWSGATGDVYPGGDACDSFDGGVGWSCYTGQPPPQVDNHFQTCVSPAPAPGDVGPAAVDDSATIMKGSGATTISVLANDANADGGPMALVDRSDPAHGTVALTNCGADLTYTPDANYSGPDSFTYTLNGGSTAVVSVTVTEPAVVTPPPPADTSPPETTITKDPPNKTDVTSVKFKFSSDEQGSTFECKLDKKKWKACTSPKKVKNLEQGKHTFQVRATDQAGNLDPTPAKDKFKVVG